MAGFHLKCKAEAAFEQTEKTMNKKIDYEQVKTYPIEELANYFGIVTDRKGRTFCPCRECSDSHSKNKGAGINRKNNTIHCFVCNGTWDTWTLTGMLQFGLKPKECFEEENREKIAEFLQGYGVPGIEDVTWTKAERNLSRLLIMPEVAFPGYGAYTEGVKVRLNRLVGLKKNPFIGAQIKTTAGEKQTERYFLDKSTACITMFEKTLNTLNVLYEEKEALDYQLKHTAKVKDTEEFCYDFNVNLIKIKALSEYLKQMKALYETLEPEDTLYNASDCVREAYVHIDEQKAPIRELLNSLYPEALDYVQDTELEMAL